MKTSRLPLLAAFTLLSLTAAARADIGYQFVTVGNPGNANDIVDADGFTPGIQNYGSVGYAYRIGKYDVTLNQYTTFLNAVASTDTYSLYNSNLATDLNVAGIARSGSSGSYIYSVIGDGQRPVTYVSWFDAARFINWMNNGQPSEIGQVAGSTEQGAYTLNGIVNGGLTIGKNANAQYWIPSENEWYKAAYYDPALNEGTGGYWLYPTRSNSAPGNVVGSGTNQANYRINSVFSVTQSATYDPNQNYLTDVGAFTNSASAYGTYDQGGDVLQWTDGTITSGTYAYRAIRGGSSADWYFALQSLQRSGGDPASEYFDIGFRVATVPEPSTVVSIIIGLCVLAFWRKRHAWLRPSRQP